MSFSTALTNALSGLTATSRAVEIVSTNVANALTEGYAPRELSLSSRSAGGEGAGVQVDGVRRRVDIPLLLERRAAQAAADGANTRADGLQRIETVFGDPTEPGSLAGRIATLEASLVTAASAPESVTRLDAVAAAARDVAGKVRSISGEIQSVRREADAGIARDVGMLNDSLRQIAELDGLIFRLGNGGRDVTALQDQRQAAVDRIAGIVPVRQVDRDGGKIALFTEGGAILYDGRPAELGFTAHPWIEPHLTLAGGDLSGLTLNGVAITTGGDWSPIRGGSLAARFDLRDQLAPEAQSALDGVARDLVERFQDPALDATLGPADAGLFTDSGLAFLPADTIGLSGRLTLNAAVDPAAGGASWRLRDGLGAAAPGDGGDSRLLLALGDRLAEARAPVSGPLAGVSRGVAGLAADLLSSAATGRQLAERTASFDAARLDGLREQELRGGVDTDEQMRQLLLLEQAYAANARVIETLDTLMQSLLRI
jgi:flagellar hook-associated protein 1 FlgK